MGVIVRPYRRGGWEVDIRLVLPDDSEHRCGLIGQIQGSERSMSGLEFRRGSPDHGLPRQLLTAGLTSGDARALTSVMVQATSGEMDEGHDEDEHRHPDEHVHAPRPRGGSPK